MAFGATRRKSLKAAASAAAFLFCISSIPQGAVAAKASGSSAAKPSEKTAPKSTAKLETYQDLIAKAQNLTLQRDRLQTSQVLIRGIQREARGSVAFKELARALDDLTSVFYTEKAQALFASGEAQIISRPRDAIEPLQEALRIEEGNVAVLKALARTHLILGECAKAENHVRNAESLNPYSGEVHLLRLQIWDCQKNYDLLTARLAANDPELEPVESFVRGLQIKDLLRRKETKKAKAILNTWETQMPDYPEVHYWKWELSKAMGSADRGSAVRYSQLCQNLTPRRRKSYILDVDLCKGKEAVDAYLKSSGFSPSAPSGEGADE